MRHVHKRSHGQNMVEFALMAPVFFLMLFGVIEMGRLMYIDHSIANATREGARQLMVSGSEAQFPRTEQQIRDTVKTKATGATVTDGNIAITGYGADPGQSASVETTYQFQWITTIVTGAGGFNITHKSTVTVQH